MCAAPGQGGKIVCMYAYMCLDVIHMSFTGSQNRFRLLNLEVIPDVNKNLFY